MSVPLELVSSAADIRDSVRRFNELPPEYESLARSMLSGTTYWVYNPVTDAFGPAKFVGFRVITPEMYELARAGESLGTRFDGHVTRTAIERVLGRSFAQNPDLSAALRRWSRAFFGAAAEEVLSTIDSGKWLFISLPAEYVAYWKHTTYESLPKGVPFDHAGSNHYRRVAPGDVVWVVTINRERLFLVARIVVDAVLTNDEAKRRWPRAWDAAYHIVAVPGTAEPLRKIDITYLVSDIRFEGGSERLPRDFRQSFRSLRHLADESGKLFDRTWLEADQNIAVQSHIGALETEASVQVSSMEYEIGKVYSRRDDIHLKYGGQRQGGISTPSSAPVIFLFTGASGNEYGYKDGWSKDNVFLYTGEGQKGDMDFRGGNKAIRDHAANGKDLLLFESLGKGQGYRYLGQFACASWQFRNGPDVNGTERKVIVFHLVQADLEPAATEKPEPSFATTDSASPSLDELRTKAMRASSSAPQTSAKEARELYYQRSEAVKQYVLARAAGICEACANPAPFVRVNGSPYLEPHHTRRLSDGGPDHPRFVAGICPTCHRHIHYGKDGESLNSELMIRLAAIEDQPHSQTGTAQSGSMPIRPSSAT